MQIDEAWRDDESGGKNSGASPQRLLADGSDRAVIDTNVTDCVEPGFN
jgi:hypothetical protein